MNAIDERENQAPPEQAVAQARCECARDGDDEEVVDDLHGR